jgi:hypothetical protein
LQNIYVNLVLSALAAAIVAGTGVAATTHDPWPIGVAALSALAVAVIQHLRQLPRQEWTEEQRAAKATTEPTGAKPT